MSEGTGRPPFGQADYDVLTSALDGAMAHLKGRGMTEDAAQACLKDFLDGHYFQVWRAMHPDAEDGPSDILSKAARELETARATAFPRPMVADPACEKCGGRGEAAVPGSYFRGGPVMMPCDCRKPV